MTPATGDMKTWEQDRPEDTPLGNPDVTMCRWGQDVAKLHELRSVCKVWREPVYGRWFDAEGVTEAIDNGGVV